MRISSAGIHTSALAAMQTQQSILSSTQNHLATGLRVQTPADDPVAAVHILELQRALQESEQFARNSDAAGNRLTLEEQSLADSNTLLQRVHELALQGNNFTVGSVGRRAIAVEIRGRLSELQGIANSKDAGGEYLFAGFATGTQPFVQNGSTVTYAGDQGVRLQQIGPSQRIADGHSGHDVFMDVTQGNGTFVIAATPTNSGSGVLSVGSVVNAAQWVPDTYTLSFTSATGDYQIVDSAAAVVATGTYTAGSNIAFRGISVGLTGNPANGDSFSIAASGSEDLFTTLNDLIDSLEGTGVNSEAQFNTSMGRVLQQLDQASDHLLEVRAQVGTRLAGLDTAAATRDDQQVELKRMTSDLRDLDYADAITRMNQQLIGLQAAQASYSKIAQLSLFNYL
jgi:flagellar hook-associated protein 3 FlgL